MMNFFFLIWIFTEASKDAEPGEFRLMQLEKETPNVFALVTQFLNANEFLFLALGSKKLHNTLNGSLENLKRNLNDEFVTKFAKYFVTPLTFPQKERVLPYFHFFCVNFGATDISRELKLQWERDDSNAQKMVKFTRSWEDKKPQKHAVILEGGKLSLYVFNEGSLAPFVLLQIQDNRFPLVVENNGVLEDACRANCPNEIQKVGAESVMMFNFRPECTVVSYLTPENFLVHIRTFPFAEFPGFN